MCVLLLLFLSSIVLHSVSAGGVYCAKTARARAAALGLDYPGVHGGPDLYRPPHHGMHHSMMAPRPQPENNNDPGWGATEPNMASNEGHPRSLHGAYRPVQAEYTTDQVLGLPRERSLFHRKSNFKQVKHVAPPSLAEAPGQPDLVNRDPRGRNKPLSHVYNKYNLLVDESVPNRHGMSQSRGHGAHQRRFTGYGLRREVPVLSSYGIMNSGHIRATTSSKPAVDRRKWIRFPGLLPQPLHQRLNVKQYFQGNPVRRHLTESKIRPN
ncbi:uncharacterized protein [Pseudochaenichthys georgianus]|uniref:uncharacterized protein n=1 Tax=Pseudochaenichthys georgianus TaxID=52239 RepID=UPI001469A18A|nr:uncharacterized protein LOC117461413 [Pseudochaenichthys georgianus]